MGIDFRWRDEAGTDLAVVEDPHNLLAHHVGLEEHLNTVCLRFIDRYGDAIFNQRQIPILMHELQTSMERDTKPALDEHVRRVLAILGKAVGEVHTYAWFIGD